MEKSDDQHPTNACHKPGTVQGPGPCVLINSRNNPKTQALPSHTLPRTDREVGECVQGRVRVSNVKPEARVQGLYITSAGVASCTMESWPVPKEGAAEGGSTPALQSSLRFQESTPGSTALTLGFQSRSLSPHTCFTALAGGSVDVLVSQLFLAAV